MIGVRGLASDPPPAFRSRDALLVGGAELAAEELSAHLSRLGHEVVLYTRGGDASRDPRGFALKPMAYVKGRGVEALSHSFLATLSALRCRFDLLHFHAVGPSSMAGLARLSRLPTVVTVQGLDWQREKWSTIESRILHGLGRIGLRSASAVIAVAPSLGPPLRALGVQHLEVIPNGCSPVAPEGAPLPPPPPGLPSGRYFLLMSRLVPEKNVHGVLRAYRNAALDWPLVVAGGGADTPDYVASLRKEAEGREGIRLVGPVTGSTKEALLRHAGGFVNASFLEGLSLGILEALGTGIPVAVSSIQANLDVFALAPSPPPSLRTFAPEDEAGLAAALRGLTQLTPDARQDWTRYAATVRDRFSWQGIATRTEALYREVLTRTAA